MEIKKFLFVFLFISSYVFAQQPDSAKIYKLSDVVVTATRTAIHEVEAASSISIIDSASIANSHDLTVYELLKNQYGLSLTQQGPQGSLSYIYLRGSGPGDTQVLVDGIPMNMPNDPGNTFDFADLPVDNISRIEILRGPQSTLYGSNALGGVINIITKQGYGKPKFYLSGEGGAYNTYKGLLGLNGSLDKFNYSITASRLKSDGFSAASKIYGNSENDGTENYNISSRFGYNVSNNFDLNFYVRYINAKSSLDQHGGLYGDDPTYIYKLEESSYKAEGKLSLLGGKWQQIYGVSFFRNVRQYAFDSTLYNPFSSSSIYDGNNLKFEWQNNLSIFKNNLITLGIESEQEKAISTYFSSSAAYGNFASLFPQNQATTTGIYLQDQLQLRHEFFSSFGIRYDNHTRFGSVVTYRIAPAYVFWQTGTKIKATYGTAFKAPSLFYLFDPAYGNKDLKPEKSTGWDVGIEQYILEKDIIAGVNYFKTEFKDLFGTDNDFKTININSAESKGVEFYLTTKPVNNISVSLNYTLTETKDNSAGSIDYGHELLRRPKHKFGMSLDYGFLKNANAGIQVIYVGQREDKDFSFYPAKRVELGGYTIVNLSASYGLTNTFELYGRIDNLFDKYYEDILGFATPGLSAYGGIKLNL